VSELIIYDIEGKPYLAKLVDGIPQVDTKNSSGWVSCFSFGIKTIDENNNLFWHKDGERHRLDEPAIEYCNSYKSWHINGQGYSEIKYLKKGQH